MIHKTGIIFSLSLDTYILYVHHQSNPFTIYLILSIKSNHVQKINTSPPPSFCLSLHLSVSVSPSLSSLYEEIIIIIIMLLLLMLSLGLCHDMQALSNQVVVLCIVVVVVDDDDDHAAANDDISRLVP